MVLAPHFSLTWFSRTVGVELKTLERVATDIKKHYRTTSLPKTTGGRRQIEIPSGLLKHIQTQIVHRILRTKQFSAYVHGSAPGRSPRTNAEQHVGKHVVVTVDIRSFFPSVTYKTVYSIWCDSFACGPDLSRLLTRISTHKGCLPQGAPTSSYLANWALAPLDDVLAPAATALDVSYTRFVDDICLSGDRAPELVSTLIKELATLGYAVNRDKVKVRGPNSSRTVTGYSVSGKTLPSVPQTKRKQLIADIRKATDSANGLPPSATVLASLKGRIAHVRPTNPGSAKRFERALSNRRRRPTD